MSHTEENYAFVRDVIDDERPVCWICFEDSGVLFTPCLCNGSMRYVHTECLDQWRATDPVHNSEKCQICGVRYRLGMVLENRSSCSHLTRFLAQQPIVFYVLNQLFILGCALLLRLIDHKNWIIHHIGPIVGVEDDSTIRDWREFLHDHVFLATYYIVAVVAVLFGWSIIFLINLARMKRHNRRLYLSNFCQLGCNNCCCLVAWMILAEIFNPFLGVLTMTLMLQIALSIHYRYIDQIQEMQMRPVLPYYEPI
jgi:hypothetical protein